MSNKESRETISALKERFLDGEKLTLKEIVDDYLAPKNALAFFMAKDQAKKYIQGCKRSFKQKDGLWFGCLDAEGHYGFATTKPEIVWIVMAYYKFVRGNMQNVSLLVKNARANGILPSGMREVKMLMPFTGKEEKDENQTE